MRHMFPDLLSAAQSGETFTELAKLGEDIVVEILADTLKQANASVGKSVCAKCEGSQKRHNSPVEGEVGKMLKKQRRDWGAR